MERRITNKVETHQIAFKDGIREWLKTNECHVKNIEEQDITSEFLKFVFDHPALTFTKEDFQKRKRVKNVVSYCERCTAKRANGEQCTRRRKEGSLFCGTHAKGTPHGVSEGGAVEASNVNKIEVWVEEINGINYYIDSNKNVYRAEDIVENKSAPAVIAKWELENDVYTIPAFNM
jgi:hypothetical protein